MSPLLPEPLARRFDWEALEADRASIVVLDGVGTIVWGNQAWFRFFEDNAEGGDPASVQVGAIYVDAIHGTLGEFYAGVFDGCRKTGRPFEQDYECSSATAQRFYRLRVLPVGRFVIIAHHVRVIAPRPWTSGVPVDLSRYAGVEGILVQCSNCRRVRTVVEPTWEWVPEVVARPPDRVSHGLCDLCEGYYFGALAD